MPLQWLNVQEHSTLFRLVLGLLFFFAQAALCVHILLNKRNVRSAIGWVGVVLLSPVVGGLAYYFLGINRIKQQAKKIRDPFKVDTLSLPSPLLSDVNANQFPHISYFQKLGCGLGLGDYTQGNHFNLLVNGDEAFPAMLSAIRGAKKSVALSSYIFDYDLAGQKFIEALVAAKGKGVEVYVLIDDVGIRYSRKKMTRELSKRGIRAVSFLPAFSKGTFRYFNMRNHRKMLLVDGEVGFVGGMNIRHGNVLKEDPENPIQDIHFRVEGKILKQMNDVFQTDWEFTTGEKVNLPFEPKSSVERNAYARVVADGPDDQEEKLRWLVLAALSMATSSLQIVTPYFLPNEELVDAMQMAALKGVRVELILPTKSNLFWMDAAMRSYFKDLLKRGVQIFLNPEPFDHSKMLLMDRHWAMIGSANWDERSFCLNFEMNVEIFDFELNQTLSGHFEQKKSRCREIGLKEVKQWPLSRILIQDSLRLFYPYL